MINVLIRNLVLYLIFLTIINSNELFPCNITTNLNEQKISVQYQTKAIQDGRIYLFKSLIFILFLKNLLFNLLVIIMK